MFAAGALAALALLALGALAFVYSGVYDVAADEPHGGIVEWGLETLSERSIARRAGELPAPLPTDTASLLHGLEHYRAMCVQCHGAPGVEPGEVGAGLNPRPPRLHRAARRMTDAEIFWVARHGIKATGMPAFGATHSDEALLQIVAVVRRLTETSDSAYAAMIRELDAAGVAGHHAGPAVDAGGADGAGHAHPPGSPPHQH